MEAVKSGLRWLLGPGIENLSLVPPLPAGGSNPTATPANVYTYHNQVDEGDAVDHFWSGVAEGPWGLVTSRYTLAVIIMAILMNRIQHLCRPQRRRAPMSARARLLLRLPSLLVLALTLWPPLLLLATYALPPRLASYLPPPVWPWSKGTLLLPSSARQRDASLMWHLFLAVCGVVVSATLATSLAGGAAAAGTEEPPSFNLVGFVILVHFHAQDNVFPPGPHVLACVVLQAAELLVLETAAATLPPPSPRLPITTFFGLISTVHYLSVLLFGSGNYPSIQSFNRAPDVLLICIILLTVILHGLTMLVTEGRIDASRLVFTRSNLPAIHEDYSLALFKLGTACLESTRLSGLAREMTALPTPAATWLELAADGSARIATRAEALGLPSALASVAGVKGWQREVRVVRVARDEVTSGAGILAGGARWAAAKRFLLTLAAVIGTLARATAAYVLERLPFEVPPAPQWMHDVPRRARLAWHGTRGETARNDRLATRAAIQEARGEIDAVRALLADPGFVQAMEARGAGYRNLAELERAADRLEELLRQMETLGQAPGPEAVGHLRTSRMLFERVSGVTAEQMRSGAQAQQGFARAMGGGASLDEDDEEDEDWREEQELSADEEALETEEEDDEDRAMPIPEMREAALRRRLGPAGRSSRAPTPLDTDAESNYDYSRAASEEADDSATLLELAQLDFDRASTSALAQRSLDGAEPFNHVLMAHLTSPTRGALTRRGYKQLVSHQALGNADEAAELLSVMRARRAEAASAAPLSADDASTREAQRACVICLSEERSIICWPCRCLALCDACRESLASRPPKGAAAGTSAAAGGSPTHTCPTCRAPVEAYSRIYWP